LFKNKRTVFIRSKTVTKSSVCKDLHYTTSPREKETGKNIPRNKTTKDIFGKLAFKKNAVPFS
jgi:hypothetical protein